MVENSELNEQITTSSNELVACQQQLLACNGSLEQLSEQVDDLSQENTELHSRIALLTTPDQNLGESISAIEVLILDPTTPPGDQSHLTKGLEGFQKAEVILAGSDLAKAIGEIEKAVKELSKVTGAGNLYSELIEGVRIRLTFNISSIAALPQSDPKKVVEAEAKLREGDTALLAGDYVEALKSYQKAAKKASEAM